jgi:anti-sigma factor (TIGR02949 family)
MRECAEWRDCIAAYVDGELRTSRLSAFRAHLETCSPCAASALAFSESKSAIRRAGNRYTAPAGMRMRVTQSIAVAGEKERGLARRDRGARFARGWTRWPQWALATAAVALVAIASVVAFQARQQRPSLAEFADLHVAALASGNPVDIVSTDRHTVKPWFQGRVPFTFDLPELQGSAFRLVGGRVAYVQTEPAAHLIFGYQRHFISVFIFRDTQQPALAAMSGAEHAASFNLRTWTQRGLRYVVIGDASGSTIEQLSGLLQHPQ